MSRYLLLLLGTCVPSTVAASDLTQGIIYGNELGCVHAAGGDGSDGWRTLTVEGITGYEAHCEFISLNVGRYGDYLASAICSGEGYTFPELFSISPVTNDSGLNVVAVGQDYEDGEFFGRCEAQ